MLSEEQSVTVWAVISIVVLMFFVGFIGYVAGGPAVHDYGALYQRCYPNDTCKSGYVCWQPAGEGTGGTCRLPHPVKYRDGGLPEIP